jgi:DNA-binding response OmpR family regulator
MRAHPEPIGYYTPASRLPALQPTPAVSTVAFVVPAADRTLYSGDHFTRLFAHSTSDAMKLIAVSRPRLVVIDWDDPSLGAAEVGAAAQASTYTSVLVTTADVASVPKILKAGCQGVLLKPFAASLLAARVGRVLKETERAWDHRPASAGSQTGTNRVWPDTACPKCGVLGATSFDFSSYRRMWYACLSCDHTWLGPRQE